MLIVLLLQLLRVGVINGVTLIGLLAQTVRIKLTDPVDGIVYDKQLI